MGLNYIRVNEIRAIIETEGKITLDQLIERFPSVSSMTLRRDLINLENKGDIIRVRGGAVSIRELSKATEEGLYFRNNINVDKKKIIAEKAAQYVEGGHAIFIDSGSTTLFLAKSLQDINYNIVTNGLSIAIELSKRTMPTVLLLGGNVSKNNLATSGSFSMSMLQQINIEIAIISATAFSVENGFTCGGYEESEVKKFMLSKARKKIMLLDSSKIEKVMPYTFGHLKDINILISDGNLPKKIAEYAVSEGVKVE